MAGRRSVIWDDQLYRPVKMTKGMRTCVPSSNDFEWVTSRNAFWTKQFSETLRHLFAYGVSLLAFSPASGPRSLGVPCGSALGSAFSFSLR